MKSRWQVLVSVAALGTALFAIEAIASTTVSYGRITAVRQVNIQNEGAQAAGTLIGGALGVASARASRAATAPCAASAAQRSQPRWRCGRFSTGCRVHRPGRRHQLHSHHDRAGRPARRRLRLGGAWPVEQHRLAPDERCDAAMSRGAPEDTAAADACEAAKQQLLDANTDAEFDRAEAPHGLLCGD